MSADPVSFCLEASATGNAKGISDLFSQPDAPDPNLIHDEGGFTMLVIASDRGHAEVVSTLIQLKCDPNVAVGAAGTTPLMRAAMSGHGKVVDLLLQSGADPIAANKNGDTGLIIPSESILEK